MFIDKDWLAQQEAINEQLRQRAKQRTPAIRSPQRSASVRIENGAGRGLVQRSLAAAGRVLTPGG
jgi:hypothetical protein